MFKDFAINRYEMSLGRAWSGLTHYVREKNKSTSTNRYLNGIPTIIVVLSACTYIASLNIYAKIIG